MPPHLLGPAGPGPLQHPHPHYIHYVQSPAGPMFNHAAGPQVSPYPNFQPNAMAVSQAQMHPQQQQQLQQQQQAMSQQRYRTTSTSNSGPGPRQVNPGDVQSPNHILAATGQPILAQINAGSPSQPPSYMQLPPQAHPQFAASMAAMMQNPMLMRLQPGSMGPVMVTQPPGAGPIPITSVSGMMDPSGAGGHPTMAGHWMPQHGGQAPPGHMPGVPPPNSLAGPHLAQPPPQGIQGGGGPQHNPAVANSAQVNWSTLDASFHFCCFLTKQSQSHSLKFSISFLAVLV